MNQENKKIIEFGIVAFLLMMVISYGDSQASTYKRDILLSQVTGNTYYLDAVRGDDNNNGSQDAPWRTLAKAQLNLTSGDCVILNSGNYGAYEESNITGRNGYILYIANLNASVHFDRITIVNSEITDTYLIFHGISVQPEKRDPCAGGATGCSDPQYPDSTQSTYSKTWDAILINKANYLKIIDCKIEGQSKHLTVYAINVAGSQNITVDHCIITKVQRGINLGTTYKMSIINNHIHDIGASGIVEGNVACSDILIEGNHIHNSKYKTSEDYAPRAINTNYHGSGIALRNGQVVVRNNIIHDGFASAGIMSYNKDVGGEPHFDDILIENNLVYDISTPYTVRLYLLGDNVVLRNNTFIGWDRGYGGGEYRMNTALQIASLAPDGSPHLTLSNNILIGATYLLGGDKNNTQSNNIYYSLFSGGSQCSIGNESVIFTCSYSDFPTTEVTDLFACGNNCNFSYRHGVDIDYTLAKGSLAINFGDHGNQPLDSIGFFDNGFLFATGQTRTSEKMSAGAYEIGGNVLAPINPPFGFILQQN